jgi:glycosyltransferase involved in cell wall biosynthesis
MRVALVGHPFMPIGMGEHLRRVHRALRAAGTEASVRDVYGMGRNDSDIRREFDGYLVQEFSPDLNIFCLNADEILPSLKHLSDTLPKNAFNIVYPMWELSKYPTEWGEQLNKFDEVWVASTFTQRAIQPTVDKEVMYMPLAGEIKLNSFLGRRYFGILESSFVFLFFFDFTSYMERKNPFAVLQAFEDLCKRRPSDDLCLVIKAKGGEKKRDDYDRFREYVARYKTRVMVIENTLSDNEMNNLVRCCDCFLSLHRSEGFGLGLIGAMFLGKAVVATAYSSNLDFMTEENSCLVRNKLCAVSKGAYPFAEGQQWAEADIGDAVHHMVRLVSDRDYTLMIGENASRHIRVHFSYQAAGLRYLDRIREILAGRPSELAPRYQTASRV